MSDSEKAYVVKSGSLYWNGKRWHACLRCAVRLTQQEAHRQAHKADDGVWQVARVRPKRAADSVRATKETGR